MDTLSFLNEIFLLMRRHGFASSKADFSMNMLGRAGSYLTSMNTRDRRPSPEVIQLLRIRLQARLDSFERNPHLGKPYAKALNLCHMRLRELVQIVESAELMLGHSGDQTTNAMPSVRRPILSKIRVLEWLHRAQALAEVVRIKR